MKTETLAQAVMRPTRLTVMRALRPTFFLSLLSSLPCGVSLQASPTNLAVAIYNGNGAAADKTLAVFRAVAALGHRPMGITAADVRLGRLTTNNFDVLLIPSGEQGTIFDAYHYADGSPADATDTLASSAAVSNITTFVSIQKGGFVGLEAGAAFGCWLGLCSANYLTSPGAGGVRSNYVLTAAGFGSGSQDAWRSEGGGYFTCLGHTGCVGCVGCPPPSTLPVPSVIATDSLGNPVIIQTTNGVGRVALSAFCLELRGDSEDDWTIWDNWAMNGIHNNSTNVWLLLGRMIAWAAKGDSSVPNLRTLPAPSASRVAIVATHTNNAGAGPANTYPCGAYPGLLPALARAIEDSGHRPLAIRFVDIHSNFLTTTNFKVVVFPGGNAAGYYTGLAGAVSKVTNFVAGGGSYLGICAGSFYAATNVNWNGINYAYPLGLFQGTVQGPITNIANWPAYALTTCSNNDPVLGNLGVIREMYYGGGFHFPSNGQVVVSATFTTNSVPVGSAQAVRFNYGRGRVLLLATHPEARAGSLEDWLFWDNYAYESNTPVTNSDNSWRVLNAAFNQWLAPPIHVTLITNANGHARLYGSSVTGLTATVFGSTDLVTWGALGPAAEYSAGRYYFADTNGPALPRRFYRFQLP